jgi:alkanesulfonate monooxygenase SsuD/methylene tetrahydromethanopterin reductase-like flavin-dependent oxidoreductase (luciferase family)
VARDPKSVLIFNLQTIIVDETDAKAKAKHEDYKQYINLDGALALGFGWMGIDFGCYAPHEPLRHIETNAVQSSVEAFSSADPRGTLREKLFGAGPRLPQNQIGARYRDRARLQPALDAAE